MTTVYLPNGDEAEASFEIAYEDSDNGMTGVHYQAYFSVSAYLIDLAIYLEDGGVAYLDRETAIKAYGKMWVRGCEDYAAEAEE